MASGVAQVTVAATTNHASATAVITPTDAESGTTGHQVNLTPGGDTVITVVVTAEDGSDKTYTVGVARAAAGGLTSLSVSPGTLSPPFDREQGSYRVEVGNAVTQVTIITEGPAGVQVQFAKINVVLPDADAVAAGHQVDLVVGDNVISVIAVGPSSVIKTYVVTVARAASDDATLSALTLVNAADDAAITLSPAFVSGTTHEGYTASVASGVATATVTATATHDEAEAVITPTDADSNTAGHQVNLTAGDTTEITVEVTAEDGATTKTYTVTVTRAAAGVSVVTLKLDPTTIDEDAGTAVNVTATLSAAKTTQFTVTVSAAAVFPATDAAYTLSANTTLTFAVNATESTGTVTITPVNNPDNERDKVITVSGAVAAGVTGVTGPADVTLTIEDDDHPVITHTLTLHENDAAKTLLDPAMIPENVGQVCVRLTATTESDLPPETDDRPTGSSRSDTAVSPGDFSAVSGQFYLPRSAYSLESGHHVAVRDDCAALRIVDDSVDEGNEQFALYTQQGPLTPQTYEFEFTPQQSADGHHHRQRRGQPEHRRHRRGRGRRPGVHRNPGPGQHAGGHRGLGRQRRLGDRRHRLHGRLGHADLRAGRHDEDRHRGDAPGYRSRGRRDLHGDPEQREQRRHRRRGCHRHHCGQRRRADGVGPERGHPGPALRQRRDGVHGQRGQHRGKYRGHGDAGPRRDRRGDQAGRDRGRGRDRQSGGGRQRHHR